MKGMRLLIGCMAVAMHSLFGAQSLRKDLLLRRIIIQGRIGPGRLHSGLSTYVIAPAADACKLQEPQEVLVELEEVSLEREDVYEPRAPVTNKIEDESVWAHVVGDGQFPIIFGQITMMHGKR